VLLDQKTKSRRKRVTKTNNYTLTRAKEPFFSGQRMINISLGELFWG
jgi:hypothetical protein